jgi:two-component system, NtrC family, response regulator AtoC
VNVIEGALSWLGTSQQMQRVRSLIEGVAPTALSVLISGQSGTGKELAARSIHDMSRRDGPFVAVNCGAMPAELVGGQLFGHERGSFTGAHARHIGLAERADGGTLFLDEITEMSPALQVYLLRLLESRRLERLGGSNDQPVDLRVVSATNIEPRQAIASGKLREDLYYRLADVVIHLPPLASRGQDIGAIAHRMVEDLNRTHGTRKALHPQAMAVLRGHTWPGNVRELKSVIARAFLLAQGEHVMPEIAYPGAETETNASGADEALLGQTWAQLQDRSLLATLRRYNNDKTATARALGISVRTVHNRLSRLSARDRDR